MNIVAFDLEVADWPEGDQEPDHSALGITCAATAVYDDHFGEIAGGRVWHTAIIDRFCDKAMWPARMTPPECCRLTDWLAGYREVGFQIVTWNGNFDFQVLGHECKDPKYFAICQRLAWDMYDPMFQFLTMYGYPVGLDKVAQGMSIGSKEGMTGADAPKMWKESPEAQEKVLKYVMGDARLTAQIFRAVEKSGQMCRITTTGNLRCAPFPKLLTVRECMEFPQETTPWWKDNPFAPGRKDRDSFVRWLQEKEPVDGYV